MRGVVSVMAVAIGVASVPPNRRFDDLVQTVAGRPAELSLGEHRIRPDRGRISWPTGFLDDVDLTSRGLFDGSDHLPD
jgi:hypothetical protein